MTFQSEPSGATVYLIPESEWLGANGDAHVAGYSAAMRKGGEEASEALERLLAAFAPFRRDEAVTEAELRLVDYRTVYMAVLGKQVARTAAFVPVEGATQSLLLR